MSSILGTRTHTRAHQLELADRLHRIARGIERLGVSGRTDPETITIAKLTLARDARKIARELAQ